MKLKELVKYLIDNNLYMDISIEENKIEGKKFSIETNEIINIWDGINGKKVIEDSELKKKLSLRTVRGFLNKYCINKYDEDSFGYYGKIKKTGGYLGCHPDYATISE